MESRRMKRWREEGAPSHDWNGRAMAMAEGREEREARKRRLEEGMDARRDGVPIEANPFLPAIMRDQFDAWLEGWHGWNALESVRRAIR